MGYVKKISALAHVKMRGWSSGRTRYCWDTNSRETPKCPSSEAYIVLNKTIMSLTVSRVVCFLFVCFSSCSVVGIIFARAMKILSQHGYYYFHVLHRHHCLPYPRLLSSLLTIVCCHLFTIVRCHHCLPSSAVIIAYHRPLSSLLTIIAAVIIAYHCRCRHHCLPSSLSSSLLTVVDVSCFHNQSASSSPSSSPSSPPSSSPPSSPAINSLHVFSTTVGINRGTFCGQVGTGSAAFAASVLVIYYCVHLPW